MKKKPEETGEWILQGKEQESEDKYKDTIWWLLYNMSEES